MKLIRSILMLLFLLVALPVALKAQQSIKPTFKKLVLVTYYVMDEGKKQSLNATDYLEVNAAGLVHLTTKETGGSMDTTYQLPADVTGTLNRIFDGSKKLSSYMMKDKFPEGQTYSGALKYISLTDNNNVTQSFIVVSPFMDPNFNYLLDQIAIAPNNSPIQKRPVCNKAIVAQIAACQNASKYVAAAIGESRPVRIDSKQ